MNATDLSESVADEGPAESVLDEEVPEDEDKREMAIPQETESSGGESSDEESSDEESLTKNLLMKNRFSICLN